ncbi:phosphate ABC transporter permease PstA [candidate division KSB1 bacterium]|nr:phosphate ABC transporter permease PstA [candidate division KSB1 bacterium]NIR69860.1 phosphate ABC transporter permease PstA [candidate division KSB1 bacterium]NIS22979.1 phosphate ABC transporter permease PstA [candidate division KSB1 bacterium]NIT69837.1 phosphate ABC transporter permease PstA [candidate division KSB1 bacterium]NIU25759.1 phosphate ABC transporter permease PstA [candidate division KSB1 bacterium]
MKKYWKSGDPFVWLTGGALAFSLLMILGLIVLILANGLSQFWPASLTEFQMKSGQKVLGEIWEREQIPEFKTDSKEDKYRLRLKIGNRDLYSLDFKWIDEANIEEREQPPNAIAIERWEWGNFYGYFSNLKVEGDVVETHLGDAWPRIHDFLDEMQDLRDQIKEIEEDEIGDISYQMQNLQLDIRQIKLESEGEQAKTQIAEKKQKIQELQSRFEEKEAELKKLYKQSQRYVLSMSTADELEQDIKIFDIVRIYRPNNMNVLRKSGFYAAKVWEFVSAEPRESNTEGGVFPAIFGTVMLVLIMTVAVVPFGVLAAIYLREYAKQGFLVRLVRIAVNNLAGVPSIVYGVFGLGFFIYAVGGTIDQLFYPESLPTPTFGTGGILWASLTLALLTVPVVIVATEEGLAAVPREIREGSLALSATKYETLWRVVIPSAMPGILTGLILAIARAAGEVAPLMITGVVKLAPTLPIDSHFPFVHLERKFMHLGFHIYDVGFQSPNVEAAIPMVYSTTVLLLLIVLLLNVVAIAIRNRLRKKLAFSTF